MKLYYEDPYISEFETTVISCDAAGAVYHVTLESTAFYPEGGGQPPDLGRLGTAKVLDVQGEVHITDSPLTPGAVVTGRLDWERRFGFMQQHTGEHILSGLAHSIYGYDNVGFHMGSGFTTMDLNGPLTEEQLTELETLANRGVYSNARVHSRFYDAPDFHYRSKKALTGQVRIVTVDGYDKCACCGLHCASAGEVGIIKLVSAHKYKSGTRIYLLCGLRALEDYRQKNRDIYTLSQIFSVKPWESAEAARKCREENTELRRRLSEYRTRELESLASAAAGDPALVFIDGFSPEDTRRLCLMLTQNSRLAAVFTGRDGDYRYALGSSEIDLRPLCKELNTMLKGRGGGQKNLVQGSVPATREALEAFLQSRAKVE